jgi:adenylate kinase family enzyme
MRVAFIGPVGSGKSTQAQRLSWTMPFYNRLPRLSTGDLIRTQIEALRRCTRAVRGWVARMKAAMGVS